jgi:uncharacterized protein YjbJ (UPF0337 family)
LNCQASAAPEPRPGQQALAADGEVSTSSSTKESTMNWDVIKGDWMQFKRLVKERWGKLTDHNLDAIAGERDLLAERLQETYGMHKDQAELQVKAFEARHKDYQPITAA